MGFKAVGNIDLSRNSLENVLNIYGSTHSNFGKTLLIATPPPAGEDKSLGDIVISTAALTKEESDGEDNRGNIYIGVGYLHHNKSDLSNASFLPSIIDGKLTEPASPFPFDGISIKSDTSIQLVSSLKDITISTGGYDSTNLCLRNYAVENPGFGSAEIAITRELGTVNKISLHTTEESTSTGSIEISSSNVEITGSKELNISNAESNPTLQIYSGADSTIVKSSEITATSKMTTKELYIGDETLKNLKIYYDSTSASIVFSREV